MKSKAGRKSKYETHIKPNLDKIRELASSHLEKDIAKQLGVSISTFMDMKRKHPELQEALKKGQQELILDLKSALIKKALGYEYEEKTINNGFDKNGNVVETTTIHKKIVHPDVAAIHLLLKNYDRDNWADDWHNRHIKDEEIKIKLKALEQHEW